MLKAKELWHNKERSWFTYANHAIESNHIEVEALHSLVSLGTERLMATKSLSEDIANKMRVPYMKGDLNDAFTYGYSLVGKVVNGPSALLGKVIHCLHPHQDHLCIESKDAFVIPEKINPKSAVFASNMETAVNAIWDAELELGDKVLIIGFGTIGALIGMLAKSATCTDVTILEQNSYRLGVARKLGHNIFSSSSQPEAQFDVVINASASEQMLQRALEITRQEGRVVEVSWYGDMQLSLNLGRDFHYGRKKIISSQVSSVPLRKLPFWDISRRKELVFNMLERFDTSLLLDLEVNYMDAPNFYDRLRNETIDEIGVVINY